jgi:hypothetical protein
VEPFAEFIRQYRLDRDINSLRDKVNNYWNRLNISRAPHIGNLELNMGNSIEPITQGDWVNSKNYVRVKDNAQGTQHIFNMNGLQGWFNSGKNTNPLTRGRISQTNMSRFTLRKKGGNKRHTKKRNRKSRKYRK